MNERRRGCRPVPLLSCPGNSPDASWRHFFSLCPFPKPIVASLLSGLDAFPLGVARSNRARITTFQCRFNSLANLLRRCPQDGREREIAEKSLERGSGKATSRLRPRRPQSALQSASAGSAGGDMASVLHIHPFCIKESVVLIVEEPQTAETKPTIGNEEAFDSFYHTADERKLNVGPTRRQAAAPKTQA